MGKIYEEDLSDNKIVRSFQQFTLNSTSGGIILIIATVIAMVWANLHFEFGDGNTIKYFSDTYFKLWKLPVIIEAFNFRIIDLNLGYVVNDALMVVFFFVVGLEIKRELLIGELSSIKQAMLPIVGAIGGVVGPILIYTAINYGDDAAMKGWAVPMATDIAFALGILALLGNRVPYGVKVFLAALAIVDDLMAVLVIAFFYPNPAHPLHLEYLYTFGIGFLAIALILNYFKVNKPLLYFIVGLFIWWCFLKSGIHATIAGVVGAFMIPAKAVIDRESFLKRTEKMWAKFKQYHDNNFTERVSGQEADTLQVIETGIEKVQSPLARLEHGLHPYTTFLILPIFALANAGVNLAGIGLADIFASKITIGIIVGLFFGKIFGVSAAAWLAVKLKLAYLPESVKFSKIVAVSALCGIGFTMAIFVASLAFPNLNGVPNPTLGYAKIGILIASAFAAVVGYVIMARSLKAKS